MSRRILVLTAAGISAIALHAFVARTALTQAQLSPSLESDKADYTPGETASLTGTGFEPSESIGLSVSIDQPITGRHIGDSNWAPFNASDAGGFVAEYVVPCVGRSHCSSADAADGMMMRATALGATSGLTATTVLNNPAWVDTDLDDYPPGATVYITGGGFLAGETVELQVLRIGSVATDSTHESSDLNDAGEGFDTWTVQADENGNLVDATWYVCLDACLDALLELTATGLQSGLTASTQFTDAGIDIRVDVAPTYSPRNTTQTFSVLIENEDLLQVVRFITIDLPDTYSGVTVAATAVGAGSWGTPIVAANNVIIWGTTDNTLGNRLRERDWVRLEITATIPDAECTANIPPAGSRSPSTTTQPGWGQTPAPRGSASGSVTPTFPTALRIQTGTPRNSGTAPIRPTSHQWSPQARRQPTICGSPGC